MDLNYLLKNVRNVKRVFNAKDVSTNGYREETKNPRFALNVKALIGINQENGKRKVKFF